ncbi:MAG: Gfo/Idh/MocA family oxidoreductase [Ignavibacteriales bacterium]|nr:Gfo/Idh/MocA family oxidoreductase [Ignavibacteriales bacterium]
MKVAVLGLGYWGPNLVRNFLGNSEVKEVIGCDRNPARLNFIETRFPSVKLTDDCESVCSDSSIDIIVIATPVALHYPFAKKALESGKHVWVEKPFTTTSREAEELIEIAEKKNLKVFVDHTFIYTGAVRKIKEIVDKDTLGDIIYFDSVRINLGLFQNDVNVIWDLAPHDLSIMNYIMNKKVTAITANGIANYYNHENVAHIAVYFENNCFAHFHVNWTSPVKIRRMIVGGKKKMLVFDDMENFEKIKVYDAGIEMENKEDKYNALAQYRIGDMYSPKVNQTEALSLGVKEFIDSIKENRKPLTNAEDGLKVVKILEAAQQSVKEKGKLIEIN